MHRKHKKCHIHLLRNAFFCVKYLYCISTILFAFNLFCCPTKFILKNVTFIFYAIYTIFCVKFSAWEMRFSIYSYINYPTAPPNLSLKNVTFIFYALQVFASKISTASGQYFYTWEKSFSIYVHT